MKLYDYFRSSACYRVRIALNLKQLDYEKIPVHLVQNGGEQHSSEYQAINPQELVPSLETEGHIIHQSLAIIEFLEEMYPEPALLPKDAYARATARALSLLIACDIHPLNNLRVLNQLKSQFHAEQTAVDKWYLHWLGLGFDAFEQKLQRLNRSKPVCFGDKPSLADVCLIPQVYNAKRFNLDMSNYPLISGISDYCNGLAAFQQAAPEV